MSQSQGPWGNGPANGNAKPRKKAAPQQHGVEQLFASFKKGGSKGGKGGNNTPFGNASLIGFALIALLLFIASTSFLVVGPSEQGVILRFGKHVRNVGPGFTLKLPAPIEQARIVEVTRQQTTEIGGNTQSNARSNRTLKESLMLTGDENIFDVNFFVQWVIKDAADYEFNLDKPDVTVKKIAESAMREVIAQTKVGGNSLTDKQRLEIGIILEKKIQTILDDYKSGIEVKRVEVGKGDPPEQVMEKFRDVQTARNDANRYRQEGEAYRNENVPLARGQAEQIVKKAEAYKEEVVARATGEADRFNSVYQEYIQAKEVTKQRLYLETMEKVLGNSNKVVLDNKSGVVPYLPLPEVQKRK